MPVLIFFAMILAVCTPAMAGPARDAAVIERKVARLLGRMTLEEKVGQLNFPSLDFPHNWQLAAVRRGDIGAMLNVVDPRTIHDFAVAASSSRLKIPMLFAIDAIWALRVTFPPPLAWAATWRPALAERATYEIAREAAALGINWTFAPMVDMSRDPRWGRVIEGAGEDTFLASAFAAARVRGYRRGGLATSVKHFVGYGAPEGGRDYNGSQISTPELLDRYLPPFRAAIAAGNDIVMASFNTVNGVPVTANRSLVTDLLKKRLGFDGFVTSDFVAVGELVNHGVAGTLEDAVALAVNAGIDLDMASGGYRKHLADAVRSGRVSMAAVNDAVRRVLRVKHRLGLFDLPADHYERRPRPVSNGEVRASARAVARESFVLVKNDHAALPIGPSVGRIALIGATADTTKHDHSWYGPAGHERPVAETLRQALASRLRPGQELDYAPAFADACGAAFADKVQAVRTARRADLIVYAVIEDCDMQGEGVSRTRLDLSGKQQELLEALIATGKPVVLVVETGRPLTLAYADKHAAAILIAWHPGTEGRTALAEVLVGAHSPSGKLPMTFPRSVGQIPIAYDGLPTSRPWNGTRYTSGYVDDDPKPLYAFGHGLTYTDFTYERLELDRWRIGPDGVIKVSVTVRNTGSREAAEVVQLYTRQLVASRSRPMKELRGFEKITLRPGESRTVHFQLSAEALGFHDDEGRLRIEAAPFKVFAGGSSETALEANFAITRE